MNIERYAVWADGSRCKVGHLHFHAFSHDEPPTHYVNGYMNHGVFTVVHDTNKVSVEQSVA